MRRKQPLDPAKALEPELQQSQDRSIAKQEQLKRIIKRHPQRDIPLVESVDPLAAPLKE